MKTALILFFLLVSLSAKAQFYFGSGKAVNLTNIIEAKNCVQLIAGSLDPSSVAVNACAGSMYQATSGTIYVKQDAGSSTNWLPLGIATPGSLTTINGQSGPAVTLITGTAGTDFAISAAGNNVTLDIPSSSALNRGLLTSANWTTFNNKEPAITATTSADYYRGDKTFQPLNKAAVGLANVDNTSDASKPVSTATQTAIDAVQASADTKVTGVASSVDSEIMLFDSTTGKLAKRATGTGFVKATSGVYSTSSSVNLASEVGATVLPMANGGSDKALTPVLGGVVYTDAGSMEVLAAGSAGQELQSNAGAAPSWVNKSISGKAQNASSVTLEELQAPNDLLTQTAANKYLHETGNKNVLIDPSFEGLTLTGWTNNGTEVGVSESTVVIDGKKSLYFNPSNETINLVQSSTLYQAQFADGVQGLATVRIKSAVALSVCSVQAGVVSTTNCVTTNTDSKWSLYKIPFILGATSNGISIAGAALTGAAYVDDAFVGAVDLKQDVDQSRIAGESYFAGTTNCASWVRTSTTIGAITADADCPGPTIAYSTMGTWATTDSNLPRQTITNLPAGTYKATFQFYSISSAGVPNFAINDGTTTCEPVAANQDTGSYIGQSVSCVFTYASAGDRVFELYVGSSTGTATVNNSQTAPRASTKFTLDYFGSGQAYSAQCGANCVDVLSAKVSSTDVVSAENVNWINGDCTNATAGVSTCVPVSGTFTVVPNCWANASNGAGNAIYGVGYDQAASTASSLVFRYQNNAGTGENISLSIGCQKQGADFIASRTIQGSFKEAVTTPGVSKPIARSWRVSSAGVVSNEKGDTVNGNCSLATSSFVCTYNSGVWATGTLPNCSISLSGNRGFVQVTAETASTYEYTTRDTAAALLAIGVTVVCHGEAP